MTTQSTGFEILTYIPTGPAEQYVAPDNSYSSVSQVFKPHSVKRLSDNEVFTLGDRVSNDLMKGKIIEFRTTAGVMFVVTTWSNVGMNLDSVHKLNTLPSKYQEGDPVRANFYGICFEYCWIHKVHFSKNKVTYDIEVLMQTNGKSHNFRLYNVDSDFVTDRIDKNV